MSREKFEAWAKEQGYEIYRQKTGAYFFEETHIAWQVWSAATASMQADRDQLAAECAAVKGFGDKLDAMHNDLNGEGTGIQGRAEVACQQIALEAALEEFDAIETPATDRFLAEQRALGVEMFAEKCSSKSKQAISSDTRDSWWLCGEHASDFAAQLRNEVKHD